MAKPFSNYFACGQKGDLIILEAFAWKWFKVYQDRIRLIWASEEQFFALRQAQPLLFWPYTTQDAPFARRHSSWLKHWDFMSASLQASVRSSSSPKSFLDTFAIPLAPMKRKRRFSWRSLPPISSSKNWREKRKHRNGRRHWSRCRSWTGPWKYTDRRWSRRKRNCNHPKIHSRKWQSGWCGIFRRGSLLPFSLRSIEANQTSVYYWTCNSIPLYGHDWPKQFGRRFDSWDQRELRQSRYLVEWFLPES